MPRTYLERIARKRDSTPKLEEVLEKPTRKQVTIIANAARPARGDDVIKPSKGNTYGGSQALTNVGGAKGHQPIKRVPLKKENR